MSSRFIPPTPSARPNPQQQKQLDEAALEAALKVAPTLTCENPEGCGNGTFHEVTIFKKLTDLTSPTGKGGLVPIRVFACDNCGWVNDGFLPPFMREKKVTLANNEDVVKETGSKIEIIR